jgi:hypothetical protein
MSISTRLQPKLHAALGLCQWTKIRLAVCESNCQVNLIQFPVVRDALWPYKKAIVESLWKTALDTACQPTAVSGWQCLGNLSPADEAAETDRNAVAGHLVSRQASEFLAWREALRPARSNLLAAWAIIETRRRKDSPARTPQRPWLIMPPMIPMSCSTY